MAEHSLFADLIDHTMTTEGPADLLTVAPPPPTPTGTRAAPLTVDAPPKRARFDPSIAPEKLPNRSPLVTAEEYITNHISSLHEGIATLLLSHGREHLVLSQRLFTKQRAKTRIEKDDDYIPVSARVNFRLQPVKEAEELPEYKELQDSTAIVIKRHQEELKACCVQSMSIDIKAIRAAMNKHLCISMHAITSLFHIAQGLDVEHTHHTVIATLTQHSGSLLKHTGLPADEFLGLYMTTLDVPPLDPTVQENHPTNRIGEIKRALESVFVLSWDKYLSTYRENQLALSLKKEAKATLQAAKTEAAVMEIDNEIPADRTQLQELIRKEASKLASTMIKQEVSKQLRLKNGTGGPRKGAPQTKKSNGGKQGKKTKAKVDDTTKSTSRNRQRTKQRGRKAAAANKGSQSGKKKKQGSRSSSQSTGRQTSSDNRNSRS